MLVGNRNHTPLLSRKEKRVDNIEIQKFISKKADLLFALSWKSDAPTPSEVHDDNDSKSGKLSRLVAWCLAVHEKGREVEIVVMMLLFFFSRSLCGHATFRAVHGDPKHGPERAVFPRY